jgi:hypothetical protein
LRPAIANERLTLNRVGDVVLQLKSPTTHVLMSPLELMQRLAALVPCPRLHLVRFHGVLAPNSKLRSAIIPARRSTHALGEQRKRLADHGEPALREDLHVHNPTHSTPS